MDREPAGSCLDPETLAAWVGGGLRRLEADRAEAHVADCARCQAVLAAMARTEVDTGFAADRMPSNFARFLRWIRPIAKPRTTNAHAVAPWLLPVAAGVVAVAALWLGIGRPPARGTEHQDPGIEMSTAHRTPQVASEARVEQQTAPREEPERPVPNAAAGATTNAAASRGTAAASQSATQSAQQVQPFVRRQADALERTAREAPRSAPGTPPPLAPETRPAEFDAARLAQAPAESVAGSAIAGARAKAPASDAIIGGMPGYARAIAIASRDSSVRWQIVPDSGGAAVRRSTDAGLTWAVKPTGIVAQLTGGFSPEPAVCWVVGRSRVVLLSIDAGQSWRRLTFPEPVDLIAVRAADANRATVTIADGRQFVTEDGGATWTAVTPPDPGRVR